MRSFSGTHLSRSLQMLGVCHTLHNPHQCRPFGPLRSQSESRCHSTRETTRPVHVRWSAALGIATSTTFATRKADIERRGVATLATSATQCARFACIVAGVALVAEGWASISASFARTSNHISRSPNDCPCFGPDLAPHQGPSFQPSKVPMLFENAQRRSSLRAFA